MLVPFIWIKKILKSDEFSKMKIPVCISALKVVCTSESQWPDLCSKWPFFDLVFYNIKIEQSSGPLDSTLPLTGALKWGTVWTSTSTGKGIMKGQS